MRRIRLLLATLLACVCSTGAWAENITLDGVTYALSTTGIATVIQIPSSSTSVTIPATVSNGGTSYRVNRVWMTEVNSTLTDLTVEAELTLFNGRTNEGVYTFPNLKNLTFKSSVGEIREASFFQNGNLESVKFEGGIDVIGQSAFGWCRNLKTVDFGTQVLDIQQEAFAQCSSLEEVVFPAENWYVNLGKQAFYYCSHLARVVFPDDTPAYWDFTIGEDCFLRGASNLSVKIPYGRAADFRKFFSNVTFEEYPSPITFSLPDGSYEGVQTVEIENAWHTNIYYTTDGTDPLVNGRLYTGAITVDKPMVIRAYGKRLSGAARIGNWPTTAVVEAKYDVTVLEPATVSVISGMGRVDCMIGMGTSNIYKQFIHGGSINETIPDGDNVQILFFTNDLSDTQQVQGTLTHIYRNGEDILPQLASIDGGAYGDMYVYNLDDAVDGRHPQFILAYNKVDDNMLTAALVPSKGEFLMFSDGNISNFSDESRVCQFAKGSDVVITPHNMNKSFFGLHVYINGVERTEELVEGSNNEQELHLQNVTEDLLVEAKYEVLKIDMSAFSTKGGTTVVSYTNVYGNTINQTLSGDILDRVYDMEPGTPVTFTFQPQAGYELGLVLCEYERPIFKGEGENSDFEVQLQSDGSYKFVLPAEQFNQVNSSISVFYKQTGTNVDYDLNHDGEVNVSDVTALVDKILHP